MWFLSFMKGSRGLEWRRGRLHNAIFIYVFLISYFFYRSWCAVTFLFNYLCLVRWLCERICTSRGLTDFGYIILMELLD
jgi:hypothetical protein